MADKQIRIGLFADDQASAKLDRVGTAADTAGGKLRGADHAARETGSGFDRAGEGADRAEQRTLGLKDTIDGTATIMQGPGKVGIAAYVQGWADLAGGLANFVIPSLGAFRLSNIRATASTVASTVATRAQGVAARVTAAGQWALNVAMRANPIGLVITAVLLLVGAFVIAYRRSETFRSIVQGAFRAVQSAAGAVGRFFTGTIAPAFSTAFRLISNYANAWKTTISTAVNAVKSVFSGVAGAIAGPFQAAFSGIRSAWNGTIGGRGLSIPDWVPGIGGRSFTIPYLAQGGIVTRPTVAMIGEGGGPEAVIPLDRAGGLLGGTQELTVNLVLDGKVVQQSLLRIKRGNGGASLGLA